jgi:hypothetical protein
LGVFRFNKDGTNSFQKISAYRFRSSSENLTEETFDSFVGNGVEINVLNLYLPFSEHTTAIDLIEDYAHITGLDDNLQLPPLFNIPSDSMIPDNMY